MNTTHIDLPAAVRKDVIAVLAARLADAIDLRGQAKQAHWSVRGANFIALHELFDRVVEELDDHVDDLAERIAQLGGSGEEIRGTVREAAKASSMPEYPLAAKGSAEHVKALTGVLAAFGAKIRAAIDQTDELGDKGTADLCTGISRSIDKQLWFVEAHEG
jgi:starvation-inducible DNA-binding protein